MAERNPPVWTQTGSHPSDLARQMIKSLLQIPTSYNGGIVSSGDLAVSQNGTPNMSVNVATGMGFVFGTEATGQGAYHVYNDATKNITIAAADATNPRKDRIIARIKDQSYSGAVSTFSLEVVTGTPAASPAEPTLPANSFELALVNVAAAATSITNANITDRRTRAAGLGGTFTSVAIPSGPATGSLWSRISNDVGEGLLLQNSAGQMRQIWNMPWGNLGYALVGADQNAIGGSMTNLTSLSMAVTVPANRRIEVRTHLYFNAGSPGAAMIAEVSEGGTGLNRVAQFTGSLASGNAWAMAFEGAVILTPTAGSHTYQIRAQKSAGTGQLDLPAASHACWISVNDLGPSGAPA